MGKIVIQQNLKTKNKKKKYRRNFFPKNLLNFYLNISHVRLIHFFS